MCPTSIIGERERERENANCLKRSHILIKKKYLKKCNIKKVSRKIFFHIVLF